MFHIYTIVTMFDISTMVTMFDICTTVAMFHICAIVAVFLYATRSSGARLASHPGVVPGAQARHQPYYR